MNTFDKIGTAIFLRECCLYTDETDYDNIVMYDGNLATLNHCEFSFYIPTSCIFFFGLSTCLFRMVRKSKLLESRVGRFYPLFALAYRFTPAEYLGNFHRNIYQPVLWLMSRIY